jgi:hypothetical protein
MSLENIRYYLCVTCLVLGSSGLPAGIIGWGITELIPLDRKNMDMLYLTIYVIIVIFGLRIYIPRMRGKT